MDPVLERRAIVHRSNPHATPAQLQNQIAKMVLRQKRGVVRTRMILKFDELLFSGARDNGVEQRVRFSDLTLCKVARRTWLYARRYCRYDEETIKTPAMNEWLDSFLLAQHPGVFTSAVRTRIRRPGRGPY